MGARGSEGERSLLETGAEGCRFRWRLCNGPFDRGTPVAVKLSSGFAERARRRPGNDEERDE